MSLYAECPKTSTRTPLRRVLRSAVSPQRWISPCALKLREPRQIPRSPQAQKVCEAPSMLAVLWLLQPMPPRARSLWVPPQCRNQPSPLEHLPQAPGLMDSGLPVGLSMMRARLRHSLRRFHDSVHRSQSPYGTTQTLSRPDSMSVGS
jgi:hypothetical protein